MVVPGSSPVIASIPCLDEQGQRELLAGFELELGDERAKTAACEAKSNQMRAQSLQEKIMWGLIGGLAGVALGAIVAGTASK